MNIMRESAELIQKIIDKYTDLPVDLLSSVSEGHTIQNKHITELDAVLALKEIVYTFGLKINDENK